MPFWSYNKWHSIPAKNFPVSPREPNNIEEAGYKLSVGPEVFLPESKATSVQKLHDDESFTLSPGQFAFILTEETVKLPLDVIGFISVRASIKFYGLVNVSGFHVDPGYDGRLVFAVFNSGPSRITFRRGQQIFALWLADLDSAIPRDKAPKKGYQHITPEIINKIDGNHLTAYQLNEKIDEVQNFARTMRIWGTVFAAVITILVAPFIPSAVSTYWELLTSKVLAPEAAPTAEKSTETPTP